MVRHNLGTQNTENNMDNMDNGPLKFNCTARQEQQQQLSIIGRNESIKKRFNSEPHNTTQKSLLLLPIQWILAFIQRPPNGALSFAFTHRLEL